MKDLVGAPGDQFLPGSGHSLPGELWLSGIEALDSFPGSPSEVAGRPQALRCLQKLRCHLSVNGGTSH